MYVHTETDYIFDLQRTCNGRPTDPEMPLASGANAGIDVFHRDGDDDDVDNLGFSGLRFRMHGHMSVFWLAKESYALESLELLENFSPERLVRFLLLFTKNFSFGSIILDDS